LTGTGSKGASPTAVLRNPEPPEWAAEQLPFVKRRFCLQRIIKYITVKKSIARRQAIELPRNIQKIQIISSQSKAIVRRKTIELPRYIEKYHIISSQGKAIVRQGTMKP